MPTTGANAKKPARSGLFHEVGETQAARALILADRRLLWRAALFLWKMPLSAIESITLWAVLKASEALALSPAWTALSTPLMAVRNFERSAELAAFSLTSWRTRLRPEAMRTVFLALDADAMILWPRRCSTPRHVAAGTASHPTKASWLESRRV